MEEAEWSSLGRRRRRRQLQGVWKRDGAGEFAALKPLRDEQLGRRVTGKMAGKTGEVRRACCLRTLGRACRRRVTSSGMQTHAAQEALALVVAQLMSVEGMELGERRA